jgi:hypothetical protein
MRTRKRWAVLAALALLAAVVVAAIGAQGAVADQGTKVPKLTLVASTVTLQPDGQYLVDASLKWTKVPQAEFYSLWEFFPGEGSIGNVGLSNKTHKFSAEAYTRLQPGAAVEYVVTTCTTITQPLECPVRSNSVYVQIP